MTRVYKKSVRAMLYGALDLIVDNTRRSGRARAFCRPEGLRPEGLRDMSVSR